MSSLYSTSLKIELIGTGDQTGIWGGTTNTNLGTAVEQAIVGKASLVTGDFTANVATLTLTDTNASQTARAFVLDVTATLSAAGTINVPAVQKPYIVFNNTVGGFALTIKVTGLTGVVVPNGKRMLVYNNGTDILDGLNYLNGTATDALTATFATTATSATTATTATNLAAGVANNIPYQTGAGATAYITVPTNPGYVLGWNGTNFTWVAAPAATTAIALVGGSAGVVPYQSATDTTAFTAVGVSGKPLVSTGTTAPTFATLGISGGGTNSTALATAGGVGYGTGTAHGYTAAGTAGQFLQSAGAGAPIWAYAGIANVTTATGMTTLTNSPTLLSITPAAYGIAVTLPDATTCPLGGPLHKIDNRGAYPVRLLNSAGTLIGFVFAGVTSDVCLVDKSTAAGVWDVSNVELVGASAQLLTTNVNAINSCIALDSNREFVLSSTGYGVVYDKSTNTFGSVTLIGLASLAVLSAANQIIVVSGGGANFQAVTLSISGTTITVNTTATATLSGNLLQFATGCGLLAVGSSFVATYNFATGTAGEMRALTVSGTTVTIGAAVTLPGATQAFLTVAAANHVIAVTQETGTGGYYTRPYLVSGSILTTGTGTSTLGVGVGFNRIAVVGTRWMLSRTDNSGNVYAALISLNATGNGTTTVNEVVMFTSGGVSDAITVGSNKVLWVTSSSIAMLVTDASGTPTVGTLLNPGSNLTPLYVVGTNVMCQSGGASLAQVTINCSGASATVSNTFVPSANNTLTAGFASASNQVGTKPANRLVWATGVTSTQISTNLSLRLYATSDGFIRTLSGRLQGLEGTPANGKSGNEAWIPSSTGAVKIEAVTL